MTESARTGPQRKADTITKLEAVGADTWVATASTAGMAHLVPLSYAWDGECVVLAAEASSLTVRNVRSSGRARLGFGPTRDVVIVDGELRRLVDASDDAAEDIARAYADQAAWDPRDESERYVFVFLRPRRVQAWREANELSGKLLMRDGEWLF
ncbi:MAG: pyridoxamine 5'-phosphate oxidase family protein [Chloroflexota bacterium]|nr:pyridoxamine 5'-phosphate oxidase family protein [Chloroflexota bacterium]